MTTAAVLLAAGGGSRFEGPTHKLLAQFRGAPVWIWSHEHAKAAGLDHTVVVTGAAPLDVLEPTQLVHNERWSGGLAGSLRLAVRWAADRGCDAVVVGLADQPLVPAEAWRAIAETTATPITVATYGGRRGHPVRLAAEVWPLLPEAGDAGARAVMSARPDLVTEVCCRGSAIDIDTVDDLERWDPPSSGRAGGRQPNPRLLTSLYCSSTRTGGDGRGCIRH